MVKTTFLHVGSALSLNCTPLWGHLVGTVAPLLRKDRSGQGRHVVSRLLRLIASEQLARISQSDAQHPHVRVALQGLAELHVRAVGGQLKVRPLRAGHEVMLREGPLLRRHTLTTRESSLGAPSIWLPNDFMRFHAVSCVFMPPAAPPPEKMSFGEATGSF